MARKSSTYDAFAVVLSEMTDDRLASTARDYIWMAEYGPETGRNVFQHQRDAVVRECEQRGNVALLERIRSEFARKA